MFNPCFNKKPVELLEDRTDIVIFSNLADSVGRVVLDTHSKTRFEKNCFSAWASTLNMGLINKLDMVCLSPVGYGVGYL